MKTVIYWKISDTFNSEPNYVWVKKGSINTKDSQDFTDLAIVRRVKKAIGWKEITCLISKDGDLITVKPVGLDQICFITFHPFGNATYSKKRQVI